MGHNKDGEPVLLPELVTYAAREGASLDWIVCGDLGSLIRFYRRERSGDAQLVELLTKWRAVCEKREASMAEHTRLESEAGNCSPEANHYEATVCDPLATERREIERAIGKIPTETRIGLAVKATVLAADEGVISGKEALILARDARRILDGD